MGAGAGTNKGFPMTQEEFNEWLYRRMLKKMAAKRKPWWHRLFPYTIHIHRRY